ncbi:hypothetical protein LTR36_008937 [Oleoguttula mirabilis]|uniref:Uncharacterized protein n=1 Tax=Oleoguttula mirabilis TaxID=1507867 RepID=A0AAV9J8K3_9PEZI|nr:hypothetical protein LTR36_008937 [Oleoguttula mirabilis]
MQQLEAYKRKVEDSQRRAEDIRLMLSWLEPHGVREMDVPIQEFQEGLHTLEDELEASWVDHGRPLNCGLRQLCKETAERLQQHERAQARLLARLYTLAPSLLDAGLTDEDFRGVRIDADFCGQLRILAAGAGNIAAAELRLRDLATVWTQSGARTGAAIRESRKATDGGGVGMAEVVAAIEHARDDGNRAQQEYYGAREALVALRTSQRVRETEFLGGTARSALAAAGRLLQDQSPSVPSSGTSLSPFDRQVSGEKSFSDAVEAAKDVRDPAVIEAAAAWTDARSNAAWLQRQYDEVVRTYRNALTNYLIAYPSGSQGNFIALWLRKVGEPYEDIRRQRLEELRDGEDRYEEVKEQAYALGVEDLPLSPVSLADRSGDFHTDSAGTAFDLDRKQAAALRVRRVRRWNRAVARGISPARAAASSRVSLASIDTCANPGDGSDSESRTGLIRRRRRLYAADRPAVREVRRHERETKATLWEGRLRSTRRKHGRAVKLIDDEAQPPWDRTHPAITASSVRRQARAQEAAVRGVRG